MAKGYRRARVPITDEGRAMLNRVASAGKVHYDPVIMDQLLIQLEMKEKTDQALPAMRELYKRALVVEGVYAQFEELYRLGVFTSEPIQEDKT